MNRYMAMGLTVIAGAALLEAAAIPAMVVGGAALLAPRYLPGLRRRPRPAPAPKAPDAEILPPTPAQFGVKQALAKTVTFRVIVTTLDFTANYVVIGEFATAAGLSTFNLIAGPLFYFGHETVWNYLGRSETVELRPLSTAPSDADSGRSGFTMSRALAKTITYRSIATVVDFATNYVVVGDALTAAGLTSFGFFLGPFVYLGHERAWEYFSARRSQGEALPA
jgi:uncharacterized membrane protein